MATLDVTRNYSDGEVLTEADLDAFLDDIETFVNITKLNDDNLQNNGITGSLKLLTGSVSTAKIANNAITTAKINDNAVTTSKIADDNVTLAKLADDVFAFFNVPPGAIMPYGGSAAPSGWLLCDGTAVSRTTYEDLFDIVGESFGQGDNATTFNLPDLRGRFLRGQDDGAGRDPDAAGRIAMATGGNTGDNIGSVQGDATSQPTSGDFAATSNGAHTHVLTFNTGTGAAGPNNDLYLSDTGGGGSRLTSVNTGTLDTASASVVSNGAHTHVISGGDNETRPINANVNFIIKT